MMSINADNTKDLATTCAPRGPKPYPKRRQAQDAAVADLGPHAREGFEFTTTKCDGGWMWRACDEVRPDNAAQVKANGGKKGSKLPVPPRPQAIPPRMARPPRIEATCEPKALDAVTMPPPAPNVPAPRAGTKQALVGELLLRSEGCTSAEAIAITGWPAISMPQQAKACGLTLRKVKEKGSVTRYFGSK